MKKIITLLLAALLAMLALASAEAEPANWGGDKASSDWGKGACMKRAPNVQKAIEGYCNFGNNQGFMVPGYHANQGKKVGNAFVQIGYGGCKNAQWVPWDICFKQFYSMCVSGNGRGENNRVYGKKKCQKWKIANPR